MDVGLVGVGTMGSRMAATIADAGHRVQVFDILEERANTVADQVGAEVAAGPAELAERVRVVLLSLPGPPQVREAVSGDGGVLTTDQLPAVIVDLSTVDPLSTRERAREASEHGVGYLDAPVLGRPSRCGHWTLPVGGDADHLDGARPPLDAIAQRIVHVGDSGSGNVIKLLNNLMFGAINAITVESMAIARRLDVDLQVFYDTIAESNAASVSNLFLEIGPKIIAGDSTPDFALDLLQKDNLLALEMARAASVPSVVANAVTVLNAFGQDSGMGELDTSALVRLFDRREQS